jgi:hypothetical protein
MNKLSARLAPYGAKIATAGMLLPLAMVNAHADIAATLDAVDLAGIVTKVGAAALVIVGIALAFKGPDVAKRVVKKV